MWAEKTFEKNTILCKDGSSQSATRSADGKDFVLLYFSAHWCPPCRGFTPELSKWYQNGGSDRAEIVFVSSDQDQEAFDKYYSEMPWKALPFNPDLNEHLRAQFKVQGIPTLAVLDAGSGELLTDEARSDIDLSNVTRAFGAWTPEGIKARHLAKEQGKRDFQAALDVAVRAELAALFITGSITRDGLGAALLKATAKEASLPEKNFSSMVDEVWARFGSTGAMSPAGVVERLAQLFGEVYEPQEIARLTSPEVVQAMLYREEFERAQAEAKSDKIWEENGEAVQRVKAIVRHFDKDGDGRLLEQEFQAFVQGTMKDDLNGLYQYMMTLPNAGAGVDAKQVYAFVYCQVFHGRREGTVDDLIQQDHKEHCAMKSQL